MSPKSTPAGAAKPKTGMRPAAAEPDLVAAQTIEELVLLDIPAPRTIDELMVQALALEVDAGQRYAELADAMEMHNNVEVAALFRKLADIELKHARQIREEMGWTGTPPPSPAGLYWHGFENPETTPGDEVHYLMRPWHALQLALANEKRAERFFARLARAAASAPVRKVARELRAEEREHVRLLRAWLVKVPRPDDDWANDPDPPVYTD